MLTSAAPMNAGRGRSRPKTVTAGQVMHACNNKLCCNPKHLVLGTAAENTQAAYRDGIIPTGEKHSLAKYSDELIDAIRADPRPQLALERVFGVSQAHISRIKRKEIRKGTAHG
jgi:hypothetical protein